MPSFGLYGRTQGFYGNTNSSIEVWQVGNSNIDQGTLLHELVHANQILNNDPIKESDACRTGNRFIGRCK